MLFNSLIHGFRIGFSSGDMANLIDDIQTLRPTFFGSFPAFFNKINQKVQESIEKQFSLVSVLINKAIK